MKLFKFQRGEKLKRGGEMRRFFLSVLAGFERGTLRTCLLKGKKPFVQFVLTFLFASALFLQTASAGFNQWTTSGLSGRDVIALAVSPNYATDRTIYAGTDAGIYKTTDGGASWSVMNTVIYPEIDALAVSPNYATDQTVYAGAFDGIRKTTDGGASWSVMNTGLNIPTVQALAISPDYATDHTVYAGTWGGNIGPTIYGGLFKTTNGGTSWSLVNGSSGFNIRALAISPNYATDQTVYAGLSYGINRGVFISVGGGWAPTGLTSFFIQSLAVSPNYAADQTVFADTSGGVFKTTNGGTWSLVNTGLPNLDISALAVSPNYAADQTVFAGTLGGVFKTTNGGTNWSLVNTGLPNLDISALTVPPNYATDQTVFAGTLGGGLWSYTTQSAQPGTAIAVPSMSGWGMVIFVLLVGLSCVYSLRKHKIS